MEGKAVIELHQHMEDNLKILRGERDVDEPGDPQPQIALSEAEFRKQVGADKE